MDREQEIIHQQMKATRAGLADKLTALESQVGGTVQAATEVVETTKEAVTGTVEAVSSTVETVKDTVKDTVEKVTEKVSETVGNVTEQFQATCQSVAETFNLKLQAERHPWAVFGGAVAVGALGGYLLGGVGRSHRGPSRHDFPTAHAAPERPAPPHPSAVGTAASADGVASSVGGALGGFLGEQLGHLKGLAIGAMMGVVRDLAVRALPEHLKDKVSEEVDRLTRNLGGDPVEGPVLPEPKAEEESWRPPEDRGTEHHPPAEYGGVAGRSKTPAASSW
jgi:hypothetical protein